MGKVQLCHDKRFLNLWINDFPFSSFALMSSSIRCLWHEKSVCDGMSSYDQSIYVQPNPIFVPWTLYLTWSFCLRLLKKLQPCVWGIICVIIIRMKVSSLLIRNTTVARQRFYVFQMIYWNQWIINNASFSCCWTYQQPSTTSIITSCYTDCNPGLL